MCRCSPQWQLPKAPLNRAQNVTLAMPSMTSRTAISQALTVTPQKQTSK
jgi:hypothetical protein